MFMPGDLVTVHQDMTPTWCATIVQAFPDRPTVNAPGYWVDIDNGSGLAEGVPSYILKQVGDTHADTFSSAAIPTV